ncbi:hypothetical protein CHELA20_53233 [Hyphomicrobiales bacterium]|nr:hypothetical protein CHELA41_21690 [Hyphomicrobiales bacterium]CAH1683840.1 hypothetical protein CHELA20_53233 [Hyphomicrobiales bacterium]
MPCFKRTMFSTWMVACLDVWGEDCGHPMQIEIHDARFTRGDQSHRPAGWQASTLVAGMTVPRQGAS